MLKHVLLLTKLEVRFLLGYGANRKAIDAKGKKATNRRTLTTILLGFLLVIYSLTFSFMLAGTTAQSALPTLTIVSVSGVIFIFSFGSVGNELFNMKSYEKLIVLPLKTSEIIVSRLLATYLVNELYALCGFLPAIIVYAAYTPTLNILSFIPLVILIVAFLPLFPLVLASIVGVLFLGLTSKLRYKNLINSLLSLIFIVAILAFSFLYNSNLMSDEEFMNSVLQSSININQYYFMSNWANEALSNSNWLSFLYFFLVSTGSFALYAFCTEKFFVPISSHLEGSYSSRKFKFKKALKQTSALKAFLKKDLKQYFSTTSYLTNTIVGYIMWLIFTIAMIASYPSIIAGKNGALMGGVLLTAFPFVGSFFTSLSSTTFVGLSLEGSSWWISESLPVHQKTIYNSKILTSLIVASPFYLVNVILPMCFFPFQVADYIFMTFYPLISIVFCAVFGLGINIRHASFSWSNETVVVKQSANTLISCLLSFTLSVIPVLLAVLIPSIYNYIAVGSFSLLLIFFTIFFYKKNNKVPLNLIPLK
jgi:ABC-2 type transport system permease protein